jgi:DNA-binding CsgD family transcriptional regulator
VLGGAARLADRRAECAALDRLVDAVRAGQSQALVVHGEPGAGKTALLEYLAGRALGCRVVRAAGMQSEMELAFAGLHQLCAPLLDRLEALPGPQAEAVRTAFGLSAGPVPDRFLVGLAVLGLLAEVAAKEPLVCLVDDTQWLDRVSAQVLAFVARRLGAESVGVVFGVRVPGGELAGLPELAVGGLPEAEARALLDSVLAGPIDARVREQIVAETGGNPLALVELPRGLTVAELAGGFGLLGAVALSGRIEESFRRQIDALPPETRRLLYGEWLRRQRRRGEARAQLRTAHGMLEAMGLEGFAGRARRELRATGETARKRAVTAAGDGELTVQEAQIARLARDGLSNPEIGARLFLSPRTVQDHLGNVFAKLGITSRSQLRRILPTTADAAPLR